MLKTRILLVAISAALIIGIFYLPKVVVNNDSEMDTEGADSTATINSHAEVAPGIQKRLNDLKASYSESPTKEKSIIFADSLADLYAKAGKFDSAARYAEEAALFSNNADGWIKAGDHYYQAFTFAMDREKQLELGQKAQEYYGKALAVNPSNLSVKTKLAMTYLSSPSPMQGITMLREVLAADPKNEEALFNLGMLSIQSGQNDKAVERLEELIAVNPDHVQGNLLLGVALSALGKKDRARAQFEKVKKLDSDPAVQATADSYLKDLE
jgi:tetratricopeptide (TPR) repeat protein